MHATRLANFNSSTSQIQNYSTSMNLILLPPYLKMAMEMPYYVGMVAVLRKVNGGFMVPAKFARY